MGVHGVHGEPELVGSPLLARGAVSGRLQARPFAMGTLVSMLRLLTQWLQFDCVAMTRHNALRCWSYLFLRTKLSGVCSYWIQLDNTLSIFNVPAAINQMYMWRSEGGQFCFFCNGTSSRSLCRFDFARRRCTVSYICLPLFCSLAIEVMQLHRAQ